MQRLDEKIKRHRQEWLKFFTSIAEDFKKSSKLIEQKLEKELQDSPTYLLNHLRFCGFIPEEITSDSSLEKLYSKYTDLVLMFFFRSLGFNSFLIEQRADAADVQAYLNDEFSLVADAKAFRFTRTAKNQKDFKIQALDTWRGNLKYAILVGPIIHFPSKTSQIYFQAISRKVNILSFSHLAIILKFSIKQKKNAALELFKRIINSLNLLNPTKSAYDFWTNINRTMLNFHPVIETLWDEEKRIVLLVSEYEKQQAIKYYQKLRSDILKMTKEEAITALLKERKIDDKIAKLQSFSYNNLINLI